MGGRNWAALSSSGFVLRALASQVQLAGSELFFLPVIELPKSDWAAAGFGREDLLPGRADGTLPRPGELCLHRIIIMQRQSMVARDDRSNVFADALSKISFVHENKCLWKPMFMETNVYENQCLWKPMFMETNVYERGQMFTNADAIRSALFMGNNEIHMLGPFWFS